MKQCEKNRKPDNVTKHKEKNRELEHDERNENRQNETDEDNLRRNFKLATGDKIYANILKL